MKKTRIIALALVLALAISAMAACGGKGDVANLLNAEATFEGQKVYSTMSMISIDKNWSKQNQAGDLILFADYNYDGERYIVYNAATGMTVRDFTDNADNSNISVSLSTYYGMGKDKVVLINYEKHTDNDGAPDTNRYEIYDAAGNMIIGSDFAIDLRTLGKDLIAINDTLYSVGAGVLNNVGSFNSMGKTPRITSKVGDYYYGTQDNFICAYQIDGSLKLVAKYEVPEHAEDYVWAVLEKGDIFLQYSYEPDRYGDKYDVIYDGDKYNIETLIVKLKNGSVKKVKCDYAIEGLTNLDPIYAAEYGLNADVVSVCGTASKIKDEKIEYSTGIYITKNGDVKEFGEFEGERIEGASLVSANRWVVSTVSGKYLIDAEGNLIGDVSSVSFENFYDNYILFDGKIYNYDLASVYDYESNNYTLERSGSYIMLRNSEGGRAAYINGNLTVISTNDDNTSVSCYNDYYVVTTRNSSDWSVQIVNAAGNTIKSYNSNTSYNFAEIYSNSDAGVIIIATKEGSNSDYTYYTIK